MCLHGHMVRATEVRCPVYPLPLSSCCAECRHIQAFGGSTRHSPCSPVTLTFGRGVTLGHLVFTVLKVSPRKDTPEAMVASNTQNP